MKILGPRLALAAASCALALVIAEIALRLLLAGSLAVPADERNLMYQYDPLLGWFPKPNSSRRFTGHRTVTVTHNRQGFRGPDHVPDEKPVMVFLGDSFVWGFDVEAAERFTERLQTRLPEWRIYNFGVSGYGTDQEYLLLQKYFDQYKPRVVFLMFCTENDDSDNAYNVRQGGYYKPYCTLQGNRLKLEGVPVPRSDKAFCAEHPVLAHSYLVRLLARAWYSRINPAVFHQTAPTGALLHEMRNYVIQKGAVFVVGLQRSYAPLESFLKEDGIPFVDLTTGLRYPSAGGHWTPEGHQAVAEKIEEFLRRENVLSVPPRATFP